jgi:hypothetical protein
MKHVALALFLAACGDSSMAPPVDGSSIDASPDAASSVDAPASSSGLGTVGNVMDLSACPSGAPAGAACKRITVSGCPGIETESIDATIAILAPSATMTGTIVHFSGGGGEGFQNGGTQPYSAGGFQQVYVSWASAWEQTQSHGIKTAGCRPSTALKWVFDTLHNGSRMLAFCGEGFSGGSGQLGYALAQYGMGDYLDYVNELSGPPFARIDLGCDGTQPAAAQVCGASDTMRLPSGNLNMWENVQAPNSCGSTTNSAAQIAQWMNDSISVGGVYSYPKTRVEFFDCTNQATAVTAMAQIYYGQIMTAEGSGANVAFHCYSQADGCQGEGLGSGAQAAVQAMLAGCTPRHQ